jgi:hypothetical protein
MRATPSEPGQHRQPPAYTLRRRFKGERAMCDYVDALERLKQRGWREVKRWGTPENLVVEFGGNTPPDQADRLEAGGPSHWDADILTGQGTSPA